MIISVRYPKLKSYGKAAKMNELKLINRVEKLAINSAEERSDVQAKKIPIETSRRGSGFPKKPKTFAL